MRSTIDQGGRVVIPMEIRRRMGLAPGCELEIVERDGTIELAPVAAAIRLERSGDVLVAVCDEELPLLDDETVRATMDRVRR
ncbi:MAG: AbrB/MazE/SpoVT family DNA-binding domain-containing protein [Acidimicrobiales bacterium]